MSDEAKAGEPLLAWRDAARLRHRIVHGYWSADMDVLLATAHDDIPVMLTSLRLRLGGTE